MATIGNTALTFADWAKRVDGTGKMTGIIELLSLNNEMINEALVLEGNLPTGHRTTIRTGIPQGTWRLLNSGIPTTKSTTAQITHDCGNLENETAIDVDLAALNGNTAAFRLSESSAVIQGMSQQMQTALIYGNSTLNPEQFTGFTPYYNSLTAQTGQNIIDAGGTGTDNTSIWIVVWGPETVHCFTPKGAPTGLQHMDKGEQRVFDAAGGSYYAYVDRYKWQLGLAVRDWQYCVRIANIDVSDLATVNAANLINLLVRALRKMPTTPTNTSPIQTSDAPTGRTGPMGRTVIYCNRTISTYLDLQAMNKTNVYLTATEWGGRPVTTFRGIPIRNVDAILNTESRVV